MATENPRFEYDLLDTSTQEIRLLRILPSQDPQTSQIECVVEQFNLHEIIDNGTPDIDEHRQWSLDDVFGKRADEFKDHFTYQALSYTWGPETTQKILVNGKYFEIRENLFHFLHECRSTPLAYGYIWIDQICINQQSIDERNHQVQHMGSIFQSASQVISWLGPENGDQSEIAFRFIMDEKQDDSGHGRSQNRPWIVHSASLVTRSMVNLFTRPYWTRLWIVQEALLAKDLVFCLGHICLTAEKLISFCRGQLHRFRDIDNHQFDITARKFVVPKEVCELMFGVEYRAPKISQNRKYPQSNFESRTTVFATEKCALQHFSLSQLIANFSGLDCADPRDKVFGLLGLVGPEDRIEINYRMSCASILFALHKSVNRLSIERLQVLGEQMGMLEHDINDALHISNQDLDEISKIYGRGPSLYSSWEVPIRNYYDYKSVPFRRIGNGQ
jgi:hypothetical protein